MNHCCGLGAVAVCYLQRKTNCNAQGGQAGDRHRGDTSPELCCISAPCSGPALSSCEALVNRMSPGKQQLMASWWQRSHQSRCRTGATGCASLRRARCDGRGAEGRWMWQGQLCFHLLPWQELSTSHGAHPFLKGCSKPSS